LRPSPRSTSPVKGLPLLSNLRATMALRPPLKFPISTQTAKNWSPPVAATSGANWGSGESALSLNAERQRPGGVVSVLPNASRHLQLEWQLQLQWRSAVAEVRWRKSTLFLIPQSVKGLAASRDRSLAMRNSTRCAVDPVRFGP